MSRFKALTLTEFPRVQEGKKQDDVLPWDTTEFITGLEEQLFVYLLPARKRTHVEDTPSRVSERLSETMILWYKPCAEISEIWNREILLKTLHERKEEEPPRRNEGRFFYATPAPTPEGLPETRATIAEGRRRGEYEELATQCSQLKVTNAKLTHRLNEAVADQDMLRTALTARKNGQLRMTESYEGIVRHVGTDDVVVLFEVGDDLVEHTYTRDQFVDSRLPKKGDRLAVYVHVAQLPPEESAEGTDKAMEGIDEQPRRRRNIGKGPREF